MRADFDAIVVGAGVIGLAIARQLAMSGRAVLVLEKASHAGTETSSRNSEVIHAGIYYPTASLKARLCVEGRELLYGFCAEHGVATKKLGKLIVATQPQEVAKLHAIAALAKANGVHDLERLSQADVAAMEPDVRCTSAIYSPSTGIVDVAGLILAMQGDAEVHGAVFAFNTIFQKARRKGHQFVITATDIHGIQTDLTSRLLVNCAGHGAFDVAGSVADYPAEKRPTRQLAKGSYCSVSGRSPFTHLVYPVPVSGALGIHATVDLGGALRLGPDIEWVDALDYALPSGLPEKFSAAVSSYWPAVLDRSLAPSYCGIRPKLHGPESGFADFSIQFEQQHGCAGLVNLFGIESPGITAALAIANHVAEGLS